MKQILAIVSTNTKAATVRKLFDSQKYIVYLLFYMYILYTYI